MDLIASSLPIDENRPRTPGANPFLRDVAARSTRARTQHRRTRIVATIGPSSDQVEVITKMAQAGMDVARVPLAHGTIDDAIARIQRIREAAPDVGILVDLPGPKIRTTSFPDEGVVLKAGAQVLLVPGSDAPTSSASRIGVTVEEAIEGLEVGDPVALGDGGVSLRVTDVQNGVLCQVHGGGNVLGRPGVTVPASRLSLKTPTDEDLSHIKRLMVENVDFIAVSFVRSAADIEVVRTASAGSNALLVAKIETAEAIERIDEIVKVADAVMVARGDLGVRVPLEDVPHHQKHIIRVGVRFGRPVITATQMLESMVNSPVPTRAEVTDVANAVLDGTSAVMLSGETAVGVDPIRVCSTMARIVLRTERAFDYGEWGAALGVQEVSGDAASPARVTAAVTGAAWRAAIEEDAAAIIACTRFGSSARAVSRFRPSMPILATTASSRTARQLKISWGVETLMVPEFTNTDQAVDFGVKKAIEMGFTVPGDVVVVVVGSPDEPEPLVDTVRLVRIR